MTRLAFSLFATAALAQNVVNLCPLDTQPGAGTNFAAAVAKGGTITFAPNCNAIEITRSYSVASRVEVMGDNRVVLETTVALGTSGIFVLSGSADLTLENITIKPSRAFAVVTSQGGANPRAALYQAKIIGPAMAGISGVTTISVVQSTLTNLQLALAGDNVAIADSQCTGCAAGIQSSRNASIINTTFSGGTQAVVCQSGALTIAGSHFTNFTSGAVRTWCDTTISTSDFRNNRAATGGAIAVNPPGVNVNVNGARASRMSISGTTFANNTASGAGGAISVSVSAAASPSVVLRHVIFDSNSAATGGAVSFGGFLLQGVQLDASAVLFRANTAVQDGGAISGINVSGRIERGVFAGNQAGTTGGALNLAARSARPLTIANSLFGGNRAASGSAFQGSTAAFVNSTIARNSGSAIAVNPAPAPPIVIPGPRPTSASRVSLANSIVSGNGVNCVADPAITGPAVIDAGHNTQFPDTACNPAIPVADPMLDGLFVPQPRTAVLTGGDDSICAGPDIHRIDVWGQYRPRGAHCSIGAIEGAMDKPAYAHEPGQTIPSNSGDFSITAAPASARLEDSTSLAQYSVTAAPTGGFSRPISYRVSGVPAGLTAVFSPPSGTASQLTISGSNAAKPGTYQLTITATAGSLARTATVVLIASN